MGEEGKKKKTRRSSIASVVGPLLLLRSLSLALGSDLPILPSTRWMRTTQELLREERARAHPLTFFAAATGALTAAALAPGSAGSSPSSSQSSQSSAIFLFFFFFRSGLAFSLCASLKEGEKRERAREKEREKKGVERESPALPIRPSVEESERE